jgi:hypothetical protein
MEKEFVPFTEALELKELGFYKDSFRYYNNDFKLSRLGLFYKDDWMANAVSELKSDFLCLAPTYSQAFEFFREQQDWSIDSWIEPHLSQNPKQYEGFYWRRGEKVSVGVFSTHDEAQLNLLRKLIEIVKNK